MDALIVDGDEIELTPDPPWSWMVAPVKLKLSGAHPIKSEGRSVILEPDIHAAAIQAAGQMYSAPGFDTPGCVLSVMLVVQPDTLSEAVSTTVMKVGTVSTSGTFTAAVTPAINPSTGVPDPIVVKTGTWAIVSQQQNSSISGCPKQGDPGGKAKALAGSQADPPTHHWIGLEVIDSEGEPIVNATVQVETPDGRRVVRRTGPRGAVRVDGISTSEDCEVTILAFDTSASAPEPSNWLALEIVDLEGEPHPGALVEIETPEGRRVRKRAGAKGTIRMTGIVTLSDCKVTLIEIPPRPPKRKVPEFISLELVDENGSPLLDVDLEVTAPDGQVFIKRPNKAGVVRVDGLEEGGECRVRLLADS
jgi:hypothetical protein